MSRRIEIIENAIAKHEHAIAELEHAIRKHQSDIRSLLEKRQDTEASESRGRFWGSVAHGAKIWALADKVHERLESSKSLRNRNTNVWYKLDSIRAGRPRREITHGWSGAEQTPKERAWRIMSWLTHVANDDHTKAGQRLRDEIKALSDELNLEVA